jgi:hypothetical protein
VRRAGDAEPDAQLVQCFVAVVAGLETRPRTTTPRRRALGNGGIRPLPGGVTLRDAAAITSRLTTSWLLVCSEQVEPYELELGRPGIWLRIDLEKPPSTQMS